MVKYLCCHWIWLLKLFFLFLQAGCLWIILCKWQHCGLFLSRSQLQTAATWHWFYFLGYIFNRFCSMEHLLSRGVFWLSAPTAQTLIPSYVLKIPQIFCLWAFHDWLQLSEHFPADNVLSPKINSSRLLDNGTNWKSSC